VHALAHITGGGLPGNVVRVIPGHLDACIRPGSWPEPDVFHWLRKAGGIADDEMYRTFNRGVGMVAVVPRSAADAAQALLTAQGESVTVIGEIRAGTGHVRIGS
jgi:phosphoribosylformylglycinamidine cyclo-ligase